MANTDDADDAPTQEPIDHHLVLFLGGSSKKHKYLRTHFEKYSKTPIECQNIYTKNCHKHGYKTYTKHFKNNNIRIVAICPLMDSLIPFTDSMNELWNLAHNDTNTSQIRRNKALMHETIRNKTNNTIRNGTFFLIDNYLTNKKEFEIKMKNNNLSYPIVIKPLTSGGTDGVRLCYTFNACKKVIKRYLNKENGEKNININMMAQEFLNGNEYVINTISYNSIHKYTDIWRAHKIFIIDKTSVENDEQKSSENDKDKDDNNNNEIKENDNDNDKDYPYSMLYDYQEFEIDIINNKINKLIVEYVENILNILGVKYGCSHCEVMYLPNENKVCLIELNARMHGGLPRATNLIKYDQMTCLALLHCNYKKFLNDIPKYYKINSDHNNELISVRAVFLKSKINGKINMNKLIDLKKLKTFKTFARTLYDGVNYWLEYQFQIAFCKTKLEEIENNNNNNNNDVNNENIEKEKNEYLDTLNKSLKVINRIEKCEKTIDLLTCPGTVVLEGNINDIKNDYNIIRDLENDFQNGLFITINNV